MLLSSAGCTPLVDTEAQRRVMEHSCCSRVIPGNAAQSWSNPAGILRRPIVRALLASMCGARILEVGAGNLRNSLFLLKRGFVVHVFDDPTARIRFADRYRRFHARGGTLLNSIPGRPMYDLVLTTYVIETICLPSARRNLAHAIAGSLSRGGRWLVAVRGPRNVVLARTKCLKCSDGYLTRQRTFVRGYTITQLDRFLRKSASPLSRCSIASGIRRQICSTWSLRGDK